MTNNSLFYLMILFWFIGLFGLFHFLLLILQDKDQRQAFTKIPIKQFFEDHSVVGGKKPLRGFYSRSLALDGYLRRFNLSQGVELLLRQAGSKYSVENFIVLTLVLPVIYLITALVLQVNALVVLLGSLALICLPYAYFKFKKLKRCALIEEQLPDLLDMIARAMRSGHTLISAIRNAALESPSPIAEEFKELSDEITFGKPLKQSFQDLALRIDSTDLRYFSISVVIQTETGGNLSDILSTLSAIIRDRLKFRKEISVLASEGKTSAIILSSLPLVFGFLIFLFNPSYISFFWTDDFGKSMVKYLVIMMFMGFYFMQRITDIKA